MSVFSERELGELSKAVDRSVSKLLGRRDANVVEEALKCAERGYERKRARERFERLLNEREARKLADKLSIIIEDYKSALSRERKRRFSGENADNGLSVIKNAIDEKRKRSRFEEAETVTPAFAAAKAAAAVAAVLSSNLDSTVSMPPDTTNGPLVANVSDFSTHSQVPAASFNNTAISEMMANAKSIIEQRRAQLLSGHVAPAMSSGLAQRNFEDSSIVATETFRREAAEKANRAADLQAQIRARLSNTNISGLISGLGTASFGASKPRDSVKNVIIDKQGRTVDAATGEVIQLRGYEPSIKANLRARRAEHFKEELAAAHASAGAGSGPSGNKVFNVSQNTSDGADSSGIRKFQQMPASVAASTDMVGSKHLDPRLAVARMSAGRGRRMLTFNEPGRFVKLGQRLRTKAQLARLQESVAHVAKRTGIASAAKLAAIQPKGRILEDAASVPDVEWWDAGLLCNDGALTYQAEIDKELITNLVEHPIQVQPLGAEKERPPTIKLMLTKVERKKLRRQTRQEMRQESQEKIRLGLLPAPEPKVRLANLMRVLGNEAVQDPTKIEAFVRNQMEKRKKTHEAANASRKLNKDQLRHKKIKKLKEDTSKGVQVAVYRVRDLNNPAHRFKIEKNAAQLYLTGFVTLHRDCNVVVVEGGPKAQKKFRRLMLNRVKWSDGGRRAAVAAARAVASKDESGGANANMDDMDSTASSAAAISTSLCHLVWDGSTQARAFDKMQFKQCPTELFARELFRKHEVEHYWDLAYSGAVLEAAGEQLI